MIADLIVLALVLALLVAVAILVSWAAPHWVDQLPTPTTTVTTGAVWPPERRNALGWYGDSLAPPGAMLAAPGGAAVSEGFGPHRGTFT